MDALFSEEAYSLSKPMGLTARRRPQVELIRISLLDNCLTGSNE